MGDQWVTNGLPMGYLWVTYGLPMGYLWVTNGLPTGYFRVFTKMYKNAEQHWKSMDFSQKCTRNWTQNLDFRKNVQKRRKNPGNPWIFSQIDL